MRGNDGFALLETLVALVLLSAALAVFYEGLSTELHSAGRVAAAARAYDRQSNALALARAINPMALPKGSFDLGTYSISWASRLIRAPRRSSGYPAGVGGFQVALYRVTFSFPGRRHIPPISVRRMGYHRAAVPNPLARAVQ